MALPQTERYRLYRLLQDGVTAYDYLQAPEIIPAGIEGIGFLGKVYPVFHGKERICGGECRCGNCVRKTRDIEFEGLDPNVYLDSRTLAFIKVKTYIDPITARTNSKVYENLEVTLPVSYAEFEWCEPLRAIAYKSESAIVKYFDPKTGDTRTWYPEQPEESDTDEEHAQLYKEKMDARFDPAPLLEMRDRFAQIMRERGIDKMTIDNFAAYLSFVISGIEAASSEV